MQERARSSYQSCRGMAHGDPALLVSSNAHSLTQCARLCQGSGSISPLSHTHNLQPTRKRTKDTKRTLPNTNTPSLFRKINVQEMAAFSWGKCIRELQSTAPVLLQLLLGIVSHSDHRNQEKLGERHYPGICMAVATLLKERNRQMSGIQTFLSLVLFSSLVDKQVGQCKYLHMCIDVRTCLVVNVNSNFHTM